MACINNVVNIHTLPEKMRKMGGLNDSSINKRKASSKKHKIFQD